MKLLIFEWGGGTYTYNDLVESFSYQGITYRTVSYKFDDKNDDDFFEYRFSKVLEDGYDAVFSVNFFPLVAKCCDRAGIKYIAWSYDCPMDVPDLEKTFGLSCNHIFLFDRSQVKKYRDMGFDNVEHMPLAVNCRRLDAIKITPKDIREYSSDISFVGKMYDSMYSDFLRLMDDYCKGYIEAVMAAQSKVFGYYMIDDMLTDDIMRRINDHIAKLPDNTSGFMLPKEALSYAMASEVTRGDRIIILHILSKRYKLNFYSWDMCELLTDVHYRGSCNYPDQQPRVFRLSKINLNITLRILQSGIPLRALDILGSGGFLLSNYQPELAEFFVDGSEVVMYESVEDAIEKAIFYLNNDDLRARIARNGHDKAKEQFSFDVQLGKMFKASGLI